MPTEQEEEEERRKMLEELRRFPHREHAWIMGSNGLCRKVEMRTDRPIPTAPDDSKPE